MILRATVTSGIDQAGSLSPALQGMIPGTLNLRASAGRFPGEPLSLADWPGGPIPYRLGRLNGVPVAVLGLATETTDGWHLELVAPIHLRDRFGLADGDEVEVVVE